MNIWYVSEQDADYKEYLRLGLDDPVRRAAWLANVDDNAAATAKQRQTTPAAAAAAIIAANAGITMGVQGVPDSGAASARRNVMRQ